MDEEQYKKELAENGVDLPEEPKEPTEPEEQKPEPEEPKEPIEPLQTEPKEQRKRSIYDAYKAKKAEARTEREMREQVERERDELQRRLDAATAAPEHKQDDADEDAIAYARKVGADPDLVQRIIEDARKGFKPEPDESLKKDLEDFKDWKAQNAKVMEQQMFNDEFERTLPFIKETFPKADADEVKAIREKIDQISHTQQWHDKSLDYVVFMHRSELSALISPKKRGMETTERKDAPDFEADFDPNADYSKMSLKERERWEAQYKAATARSELAHDAQGKKIFI